MNPTHARTELGHSVDGELHERQRRLHMSLDVASNVDRHESPGNLLNRAHGKATKVGSANLGEETLHQQGHSVEVGNDNQRVG